MNFHDVAFLLSGPIISTTIPKYCNRGESLITNTCSKNVDGGRQGHATCRTFLLKKNFSLNFTEITRLSQN